MKNYKNIKGQNIPSIKTRSSTSYKKERREEGNWKEAELEGRVHMEEGSV